MFAEEYYNFRETLFLKPNLHKKIISTTVIVTLLRSSGKLTQKTGMHGIITRIQVENLTSIFV